MDELQISGKRFISSRRLARDHGYTADYLGQLIRGGKVVGQKVGRAWYVDAASFDTYLGGEGTEAKANPPEQKSSDLPSAPQAVAAGQTFTQEDLPPPVQAEEVREVIKTPVVVVKKEEEPAYHIPLHIIKKEEPVEEKKEVSTGGLPAQAGLRYFADTEPNLPEIRRNTTRESQVATPVVSEIMPEIKVFSSAHTQRPSKIPVIALAGIAVAVFVISAFVSSAVALNLSIEAGNAANAFYSLPW